MTPLENVRAQLELLLQKRSLARSTCSGSLLKLIRPLLDAGVVVEQRAAAGRTLVVVDTTALRHFFNDRFPQASFSPGLSRTAGVGWFRDSKQYPSDTPLIISARAWRPGVLSLAGEATGAAALTAKHGVFSFLLRPHSDYALHGSCALVENPAVFACFEQLKLPVDLALLGRGRVSSLLLQWLAAMPDPEFSLLHFPDYDPVGLSEFVRVKKALGARARLHIPANLAQSFARYSNRGLLENDPSRALLAGLRKSSLAEVQHVVALLDEHNAGLEQEALLIET